MRWPWPWITTWWWNQQTVVRFSGSVRPLWDHGIMWWICRRYRLVQPEMVQRVASRCRMKPSEAGWDDPAAASEGEGLPVRGACGDFNDAGAQDCFDGVRSDPRSGFECDTGRGVRRCGFGGIDEHRQHR